MCVPQHEMPKGAADTNAVADAISRGQPFPQLSAGEQAHEKAQQAITPARIGKREAARRHLTGNLQPRVLAGAVAAGMGLVQGYLDQQYQRRHGFRVSDDAVKVGVFRREPDKQLTAVNRKIALELATAGEHVALLLVPFVDGGRETGQGPDLP